MRKHILPINESVAPGFLTQAHFPGADRPICPANASIYLPTARAARLPELKNKTSAKVVATH